VSYLGNIFSLRGKNALSLPNTPSRPFDARAASRPPSSVMNSRSHVLLSTRGLQPITMPRCASQQTLAANVSDGANSVENDQGGSLGYVRSTLKS
jgi:hypothetical protein